MFDPDCVGRAVVEDKSETSAVLVRWGLGVLRAVESGDTNSAIDKGDGDNLELVLSFLPLPTSEFVTSRR